MPIRTAMDAAVEGVGLEGRRGVRFRFLFRSKAAAQGLEILARNVTCAGAELDIVAREAETIVFVEVRGRADDRHGHPLETIDALEFSRRGIHNGAIGYLGLGGSLDMSLATATALLEQHHLVVHTSGDITPATTPESGLAEAERGADWWRTLWGLS